MRGINLDSAKVGIRIIELGLLNELRTKYKIL